MKKQRSIVLGIMRPYFLEVIVCQTGCIFMQSGIFCTRSHFRQSSISKVSPVDCVPSHLKMRNPKNQLMARWLKEICIFRMSESTIKLREKFCPQWSKYSRIKQQWESFRYYFHFTSSWTITPAQIVWGPNSVILLISLQFKNIPDKLKQAMKLEKNRSMW